MTLREIYRLGIEETERLRRGKPLETEELRLRAGLPPASMVMFTPPMPAIGATTQNAKPNIWDEKPGDQGDPITLDEKLDQVRAAGTAERGNSILWRESAAADSVTKINRSNHRRRGRPPVVISGQLSLADQPGLSLRKRAALLGVSRMTVLRRNRVKFK